MFSFQNTSLYQEALELTENILKFSDQQVEQSTLRNKIQGEALNVPLTLAKAFSKKSKKDQDKYLLRAANILNTILVLLNIVQKIEKEGIRSTGGRNTNTRNLNNKPIWVQLLAFQKHLETFRQKQYRILILSISAGNGHMAAAKGVKQGLEAKYGYDFDVEIVDFGAVLNETLNKATVKAYEGSIKYVPSVYNFLYETTNKKWQVKLLNILNYPFSATKLKKFFEEKQPDLVISTHPFWDYIATKIWKRKNPNAKFVSLITDSILVHNAWVTADPDYHIVPNKETASSLKKLGIESKKIQVLGFPIDLKFLEPVNRTEVLTSLDLDPKAFTILLLATSENSSKALSLYELLVSHGSNDNIIIVTGKNEDLYEKLMEYEAQPNIRILGWSNEVPKLMGASDTVITKAGGATIMECIGAKKPVIIPQIVPGQEEGNAELIERYKVGIIATSSPKNVLKALQNLKKKQKDYQKNLENISNPGAALKIAEFIQSILPVKH